MPEFHGNETAAEVMRVTLDNFSFKSPLGITATIKYQGNVPYLDFFFPDEFEFTASYRVDNLLLTVFPVCEETIDSYVQQGLLEADLRDYLVRMLAYVAMSAMLQVFMVQHTKVFADSIEDIRFLTPAIMLNSIAGRRGRKDPNAAKKSVSSSVKPNLKKRLDVAKGVKQEMLVAFLHTMPMIHIQTSAGRPLGSTKPEEKKAKEKAEFEAKIEATIRDLYNKTSAIPTKTAVAETLSSGPNALRIFLAKLKRLVIDYEAIVERVQGSLNNSS